MQITIQKYEHQKDYKQLIKLIYSEGEEWKLYLGPKYKKALESSIVYVAYTNNELCGYARSINDSDFYIWIVDLLVDKKYRGNAIGQKLMECFLRDFPNLDVLVMSDVDDYYTKLGYKKEGSIFKVD